MTSYEKTWKLVKSGPYSIQGSWKDYHNDVVAMWIKTHSDPSQITLSEEENKNKHWAGIDFQEEQRKTNSEKVVDKK